MPQLIAIDNQKHLNLKIDASKAELHGSNLHLVPAVVSEFINMAVQYPLVITKHADTGEFVFAAMLGFEAGENLFWRDEQWQGLYLPLQIRRQPFFVSSSNKDANGDDYAVCFDSNSPAISQEGAQSLYDETGEESQYFQQAKSYLAQLLRGESENKYLLNLLEKMKLLQVMKMEVTFGNQQTTTLNGLYTIDQEKLANLPTENISQLHGSELLQPIYTLITSLGQMHNLIDLKNKKLGC